ncbi:4Fe-4S binding protein [candidate division KSB1 bacterium]|nr:4Fe-4S binding protein [candidate division KSB1 bacterium]RQW11445.1 MAG: 4Fe-4S binding protein [candidate division KSB1 bacterium]
MKITRAGMIAFILMAVPAVEAAEGRLSLFFAPWQLTKVWLAAALALVGTLLLLTRRLNARRRFAMMALAFIAFGVLSVLPVNAFRGLGLHPSPMCVIEKPFLFVNAGRAVPILFLSLFAFIGLLTLLSNKSFCGWTCPIGALQELIYKIPLPNRLQRKIPFVVSNSIRSIFFIVFVAVVFTTGFSLYEYVNAFHILHWQWQWQLIIPIGIAIIGGLFIYRPFCYLICPLGLFTWLLEHVSVLRVKLDKEACTDCKLCVKKSPCPTVPAILAMKKSRPDCHACGVCIEVCPEDALKFRV